MIWISVCKLKSVLKKWISLQLQGHLFASPVLLQQRWDSQQAFGRILSLILSLKVFHWGFHWAVRVPHIQLCLSKMNIKWILINRKESRSCRTNRIPDLSGISFPLTSSRLNAVKNDYKKKNWSDLKFFKIELVNRKIKHESSCN